MGIGTNTPHPSAALDISDTARGILIPRMTMNQRNAIQNPAEGLMVYQIDSAKGYWYYDGALWKNFQLFSTNNNMNFSSIDSVSTFMKYIGNGREGDFDASNYSGELSGEHFFNNFIVPENTTLLLGKNQTTVIHVKDTCKIYGIINGLGRSLISGVGYSTITTNRIGSNSGESRGNGNCQSWNSYSYSWAYSPEGLAYKIGTQVKTASSNENGLWVASFFMLDLNGYNSPMVCYPGGAQNTTISEGGSGLYIITNNLDFTGTINLKGGNGMPGPNQYGGYTGGGGGGNVIISTKEIINNTGHFDLGRGTTYDGFIQADNGNYLFIKR